MSIASHRACATLALAPLISALMLIGVSACKRQEGESDQPGSHHYDDKAAALASFEEPERDAWAMPGKVVEALGITASMDIADIGAGSGYFTRRLATAAHAGKTYAVDVDADFKDHIEQHQEQWGTPNIITRLAVYEHPLLPRDTVDLVFISNTYSFLQDRETYFTAVYKALRGGGRLAVVDWRAEVECPRMIGCPKPSDRVSKAVAQAELERVGFTVLEEHDFLSYQYFMILGRAVDQSEAPPPEPGDGAPPPPEADADADGPATTDEPQGLP